MHEVRLGRTLMLPILLSEPRTAGGLFSFLSSQCLEIFSQLFSGLAYKGFGNLWWTYPFFFTVPIRPFEKENGQSMLIRI
jgi:hypothetical protein